MLLLFGLWPYHAILGWLPWGSDATKWVFRGALDADWWSWATQSKHFVGYRPVTALSFTLNHALTGFAAWGYRATDLGLHLVTGALTFALYRASTGDRSLRGLVPVVVLLLHPASEEIVPHVARRSYLLASAFGLGALLAWVRGLRLQPGAPDDASSGPRRPDGRWAGLAAVLALLALGSNELAYAVIPVMALLALVSGHRPRDVALVLVPIVAVVAVAVAARTEVLGTLGGYDRRYFAYLRNGRPLWQELHSWQPGRIAAAAWQYALVPNGVTGGAALLPGRAGMVGAAAFTAWLAWIGLVAPFRRPDRPGIRVRWVLVAWMLAAGAIIVGSQTWFWRQAHGLLPPLGFLTALGIGDAVDAWRSGRRREAAIGCAVACALLASILRNAPFPTLHAGDHGATRAGTPLVRTVSRLVGPIRGPATVYLVLPVRSSGAHMVRTWVAHTAEGASDQRELRVLGHLRNDARLRAAALTLDRDEQRLSLDRGLVFSQGGGRGVVKPRDRALELGRLVQQADRPVYVVAIDADDAWMVRVSPPGDDGHSE